MKRIEFQSPQQWLEYYAVPIPESGCWVFDKNFIDRDGYGFINKERAHRVSYKKFVGEIPAGLLVCHKCDVPSCINPNHLFLGTHTDNAIDKFKKGRQKGKPRKTHCPKGHELVHRPWTSQGLCLVCNYASAAKWRAKMRLEKKIGK